MFFFQTMKMMIKMVMKMVMMMMMMSGCVDDDEGKNTMRDGS